MPALRTEVTEIVTGLATMGYRDVEQALAVRPRNFLHVEDTHFAGLSDALASGEYANEFKTAWDNGIAFARAADGLRGRPPWSVEWKGNQRPPGYEQIPADLRIDHVYLISCKYGSKILQNPSPLNLFENLLMAREQSSGPSWYQHVAADAYQNFYEQCRSRVADPDLPALVEDLSKESLRTLRGQLPRILVGDLGAAYESFSQTVAAETAQIWSHNLQGSTREATRRAHEMMLWRLLRFESAPYFVLGQAHDGQPLQFRVATPWDFRQRYNFLRLEVTPSSDAQQPVVNWKASVFNLAANEEEQVEGHIEIRWSHGKFGTSQEAKVYLDTPFSGVPGYSMLV